MYYPAPYILLGPQSLKITSENNPATGAVIAWIIAPVIDRAGLTIWMDGRPHPSVNAVHPVHGFTTGVWEGDILTTKTTHMQEGPLTRNGAAMSDEATLTMHFNVHGDILTVAAMLEDPVSPGGAVRDQPELAARSGEEPKYGCRTVRPTGRTPDAEGRR